MEVSELQGTRNRLFLRKNLSSNKYWTDHVRNEEVLLRVNEQRNILH